MHHRRGGAIDPRVVLANGSHRSHCTHGVSPPEVEEALFDDDGGILLRVGSSERNPDEVVYRYFGRTIAGRHLMVVLLYMGQGLAMPVTARDMTRQERRKFNAQ
jgi:hypothetical protein